MINYTHHDIIQIFSKHTSWEDKYRQILQLSKALPPLANDWKTQTNKVIGCESDVWLHMIYNRQTDRFEFNADSNARIVRGLLIIVLAAFNGKSHQDIHHFDTKNYFSTLNLMHYLSPSRNNGIYAVIQHIKQSTHNFTQNH